MNEPKNHHYVPQFYLKGFTDPDSCNKEIMEPYVWLVDLEEKSVKPKGVKNIGYKRDIYRVDIAGEEISFESIKLIEKELMLDPTQESELKNFDPINIFEKMMDPLIIEKLYNKFETLAAPIIRNLNEQKMLTLSKKEKEYLASFIGCQIARTPTYHNFVNPEVIKGFFKKILPMALAGPTVRKILFDRLVKFPQKIQDRWQALSPSELYIELLKFKYSDAELAEFDPLIIIASFMRSFIFRDDILKKRWSLFTSRVEGGYFLTSDNPVAVLDDNFSFIMFPVSRETVLYLHQDEQYEDGVTVDVIAMSAIERLNRYILYPADKQVFCPTKSLGKWVLSLREENTKE